MKIDSGPLFLPLTPPSNSLPHEEMNEYQLSMDSHHHYNSKKNSAANQLSTCFNDELFQDLAWLRSKQQAIMELLRRTV